MKKALKILVPFLMVLVVLGSIAWYVLVYDSDLTQEFLLWQARKYESKGKHTTSVWLYNLAYSHAGEDDSIAIELAEQFKSAGNYTKAEVTLSNAIADGASSEPYIALCRTYVEQDKFLDAVKMLDNIDNPQVKAELDALRPAVPAPEYESGFYNQYIDLSFASNEGTLYISTDGEFPTTKDVFTEEVISLPAGETTVYALCVGDNGLVSPVSINTYSIVGVIEPVVFQDVAIESAIRQTLNLGKETTVYTSDLWNITEFTIPEDATSYQNLSGLTQLRKLSVPDAKSGNFTFLSALKNLEVLDISGIPLTSEALEQIGTLPNLKTLSLEGCGISTIAPLANLHNLQVLNLNGNSIRDLTPLSNMPVLEELYLQRNAVNSINVITTLPSLQKLDLSYNSLSSIATIGTCVNLKWLDVTNNTIPDLKAVSNLKNLTYFAAANNNITDVSPLAYCPELQHLDISYNKVTDITLIGALVKLQHFNFSHNTVAVLPIWPADCALVTIDGSYNAIADVEPLKDFYHLNRVNFDYNPEIESIEALEGCPALVRVDVYGTKVTDVSALIARNIIVNFDPTSASVTESAENDE